MTLLSFYKNPVSSNVSHQDVTNDSCNIHNINNPDVSLKRVELVVHVNLYLICLVLE